MRARDQCSIFSTGGKFRPDYGLLLELHTLTLVARSYALLILPMHSKFQLTWTRTKQLSAHNYGIIRSPIAQVTAHSSPLSANADFYSSLKFIPSSHQPNIPFSATGLTWNNRSIVRLVDNARNVETQKCCRKGWGKTYQCILPVWAVHNHTGMKYSQKKLLYISLSSL